MLRHSRTGLNSTAEQRAMRRAVGWQQEGEGGGGPGRGWTSGRWQRAAWRAAAGRGSAGSGCPSGPGQPGGGAAPVPGHRPRPPHAHSPLFRPHAARRIADRRSTHALEALAGQRKGCWRMSRFLQLDLCPRRHAAGMCACLGARSPFRETLAAWSAYPQGGRRVQPWVPQKRGAQPRQLVLDVLPRQSVRPLRPRQAPGWPHSSRTAAVRALRWHRSTKCGGRQLNLCRCPHAHCLSRTTGLPGCTWECSDDLIQRRALSVTGHLDSARHRGAACCTHAARAGERAGRPSPQAWP